MKLTSVSPSGGVSAQQRAGTAPELARTGTVAAAVVAPDVQVGEQATRLQAAQAQLAAMPDIDAARVAEIKSALARGEITFDPHKLAQLVVRHHGGRG